MKTRLRRWLSDIIKDAKDTIRHAYVYDMSADEEDADQGPALDEESTSGMEQGAHARDGKNQEAVGEDDGDEDGEASSRILGPYANFTQQQPNSC